MVEHDEAQSRLIAFRRHSLPSMVGNLESKLLYRCQTTNDISIPGY